jgi:hypothetical protein
LFPGTAYHALTSSINVSGKNMTVNVTYTPGTAAASSNSLTAAGIPAAAGVVGVAADAGIAALALRRKPSQNHREEVICHKL